MKKSVCEREEGERKREGEEDERRGELGGGGQEAGPGEAPSILGWLLAGFLPSS